MNTIYQAIFEHANVGTVARLASQHSQNELNQLGTTVSDEEFEKLYLWTSEKIRRLDVQSVLFQGALLTLARSAAYLDSRVKVFNELIEELGISSTTAYGSIAIFRVFGKTLIGEDRLMVNFPIGSLTLLSAKSVSDETRQKAIEMASTGKRVTIKEAKKLIGSDEPEPVVDTLAESMKEIASSENKEVIVKPNVKKKTSEKSTKRLWTYKASEAVRLVIETDPNTPVDTVSILEILEAALKQHVLEAGLQYKRVDPELSGEAC